MLAGPNVCRYPADLDAVLAVTPDDAIASVPLICLATIRDAISSRRKSISRVLSCTFIRLPVEGYSQGSWHDNAEASQPGSLPQPAAIYR